MNRRNAPRRTCNQCPVQRKLQVRIVRVRGNVQGEARQLGLEIGKMLLGEFGSVGATVPPGCGDGVGELDPCRSEFTLVFVTRCQVQERAGRAIQAITLRQLRTRFVVVARSHQVAALSVERIRERHFRLGLRTSQERRVLAPRSPA